MPSFEDKGAFDAEIVGEGFDELRPAGIGGTEYEFLATDPANLFEHQRPRRQVDGPDLSREVVGNPLAMQIEQHHTIAEASRWDRREETRPGLGNHDLAFFLPPFHRLVTKERDDES